MATSTRVRETIDGVEKYCARCVEWWPGDREFFFAQPGGILGLHSVCKACYHEGDQRRGRRQAAPVPQAPSVLPHRLFA